MAFLFDSHPVFPTPDVQRTAEYYAHVLGFRAVEYLDAAEPHVCLYRDGVEIILTDSQGHPVVPNRELYGYGCDAYLITENQEDLQREFTRAGAVVARPLAQTDYHSAEFVIEDVDGRWIGFGIKDDGGDRGAVSRGVAVDAPA